MTAGWAPNLCEVDRTDHAGRRHPCGLPAGHDGDHVCALSNLCAMSWPRAVEVVHCDHLGPCARCGEVVAAGEECSTCLEEDGLAVHAAECDQ